MKKSSKKRIPSTWHHSSEAITDILEAINHLYANFLFPNVDSSSRILGVTNDDGFVMEIQSSKMLSKDDLETVHFALLNKIFESFCPYEDEQEQLGYYYREHDFYGFSTYLSEYLTTEKIKARHSLILSRNAIIIHVYHL